MALCQVGCLAQVESRYLYRLIHARANRAFWSQSRNVFIKLKGVQTRTVPTFQHSRQPPAF